MKNVIITGATGMVGEIVLKTALVNPQIGQVTSIVRKASGGSHPKLVELIHTDFTNYDPIDYLFALSWKDSPFSSLKRGFCFGLLHLFTLFKF